MSTLTIGLAIAGGVVLAAVVAHGAWQARKNAPLVAQPDDLLDANLAGKGDRIEPSLGSGFADLPPASSLLPARSGRLPDPLSEDGMNFESNLIPLATPEKKPGLDALIDVIAPLMVEDEVPGELAFGALPATRRAGSKPFAIEGLNAFTSEWETPQPGQRYMAFQAGVQLANRTGSLNDIEFSEYVVKVQAYADLVGAAPDFPDMREQVARARELDQFASSHDAQLSFTLRTRAASWSPGYVHQHASRMGFVAGVMPGRMVLAATDAHLPAILSLSFDRQAAMAEDPTQAGLQAVVVTLDVPQVAQIESPFARLRQVLAGLCASMDAIVTDDHGVPIRAEALDAIGADLEKLYASLEERDLAAGSAQARRLFS
jgi:hypothetical protein